MLPNPNSLIQVTGKLNAIAVFRLFPFIGINSLFCSTSFPLVCTEWVGSTLSSLCPLLYAALLTQQHQEHQEHRIESTSEKILGNAEFDPGPAGCEVRTLPLSYVEPMTIG